MGVEQLAEGIIEIANWNQANCIRQMTIQRGIDPRGLALLSFGGSGPAQSPAVMELLGMKACIVPLNPGNLSAFGLLAVDWRTDHIATRVTHEDALDPAALAGLYRQLEAEAAETLARDGIESAQRPPGARSRRALRRPVDGGARAGARRRDRRGVRRGAGGCVPRRAREGVRLRLSRQAEGRAGECLRVGVRADRPAGAAEARRRRAGEAAHGDGARSSAARSSRRRSTIAPRCRRGRGSTGRR